MNYCGPFQHGWPASEQLCHDLADLLTSAKSFQMGGLLQPVLAGLNVFSHKMHLIVAFILVKGTDRDLSE